MARRLVSLAAAAMGVLMLSHEADAFVNVNKFTTNHELKHRGGGQTVQVSAASNVQESVYDEAVVDHNAPLSQQKLWKQRYFTNPQFWGGKGFPVFFMNGDEGEFDPWYLGTGSYMTQLAIKHKALLVGLEHRYYGKSVPTANLSTENLRFLTSDQQMADVARFHGFLTTSLGLETSKWIAFGGSYAGSLAAWEMLKYPTLFAGAIASSGPLEAKTNFFEYNEIVGRSLRFFGGDECYNRIEQSIVDFSKLVDGGSATKTQLQKLFPACSPIKNEFDLGVYESWIPYGIKSTVRGNDPSDSKVTKLCALFANTTQTPLEVLSNFTRSKLTGPCFDSTFEGNADGQIEFLQNTTVDSQSMSRQWFYQTCNEFGWYQTTTSPNSPFHALKSLNKGAVELEVCKRVFNIDVEPRVRNTNARYGGLNLTVENVTFVSGSLDPWSAMSVTNTTRLNSASSSAVYIEGTSHCADMDAPRQIDIPALKEAQAQIAANVAKYLGAKQ